jgi:putative iron-regulated protein
VLKQYSRTTFDERNLTPFDWRLAVVFLPDTGIGLAMACPAGRFLSIGATGRCLWFRPRLAGRKEHFMRQGFSLIMSTVLVSIMSVGTKAEEVDTMAAVSAYADIAQAKYEDSVAAARLLKNAVDSLLAAPSVESLQAARQAWREARIPYLQTEAYRFGNAIVDEQEGRVNAWPLDEGLIDYVDAGYGVESDFNTLYTANVVANKQIEINGTMIDATEISPQLLSETLHEAGDIEANVATGYHAIEFLLWGQDLNGTGPGAGERPYTDFDTENCSNANCDRRARYLDSAAALLVADLEEMAGAWAADGEARLALTDGSADEALSAIFTGFGSLSYGELAGERMKLGLLLHDPEEEQDCFSDNTHFSHFYDALGIRNAYLGEYRRTDGTLVSGPSLSSLVAAKDLSLDTEMRAKLDLTMAAMEKLVERAGTVEAYDQMIGEGNDEGNAVVQAAIDALIGQTRTIERIMALLGLENADLEGSDSLDNPGAVFQ